ncbi:MAG: MMPL family transporter [Gordonia sp. (in: high G+C Gram-positive bacteria)]
MFAAIGTFVFRLRFAVIAVLVVLMGGLGLYGLGLGKYLSQSGWFDPTSQSSKGSTVADIAFGRDHRSDVILLITPPAGTTVDDKEFGAKVENIVNTMVRKYPSVVQRSAPSGTTTGSDESAERADYQNSLNKNHEIIDPFFLASDTIGARTAQNTIRSHTFTADKKHAFISIGIAGNDDTTVLANYESVAPFLEDVVNNPGAYGLPGTTFQLAGLQPVSGAMSRGMDADIHRAEVIALPLVAVMLFFVFGGVIAACLPVFIGGLTIAGSLGIMTILAQLTELNVFAQSVVTLIGLGIAIDYGLFIVSRFREELAEGYQTPAAVRRTVMTAGQTVLFSATIIVAALACLLMMPQGFLKSVAYGAIFSVSLAAVLSITVLPAILSILGPRIDSLGPKFLRRNRSKREIEDGFWGRLSGWVMRHPLLTAIPTVLLLLVLTIPTSGIKFGSISETYLPPDNPNRVAQESFDKYFPKERTEEIKLVVMYDANDASSGTKLEQIAATANKIPGFTKKFSTSADDSLTGTYGFNGPQVIEMSAGLVDRNTANAAVKELRAITAPDGIRIWVAGTPALVQDSIDALLTRLPLMAVLLVLVTGLLMFLAFGSVVLPIKAALMSALGLGATLGILTFIFVDGHGASIANFTPGPLFAAVLVLIISIVFGLSTDYEVFLLSRMVEARQKGATTSEAIRVGTAHTGRIITAAAAILVVVTGAFGLSDIVMMKYIAYGMIAALILDATVIRMLLVPSTMKLLGDDCWWAPRWMKTLQRKIGLGETILNDEPSQIRSDAANSRQISAGTLVSESAATSLRAANVVTSYTDGVKADGAKTDRPTAAEQPPVQLPPAQPVADPAARAGLRKRSDRPDTGRWTLGESGIRLDTPRQATSSRSVAPRSSRTGVSTSGSALGRRPELDHTGNRPLAAALAPEAHTPSDVTPPSDVASPLDRGLSPDAVPADPGTTDLGTADLGTTQPPWATGSTRAADRHARAADTDATEQISVQDLLRRSRSRE